ncbi:hypothetical protein GGI07_002997 [Coemansia sp. Benny D115]|nr:hypothetical protein GGI07_002997 [Coemansia sp. Benny D115]
MDFSNWSESQKEIQERQQKLVDTWTAKLQGKRLVENQQEDSGLVDENVFTAKTLPKNSRILKGKNVAMTMDFRPDRLNVFVDEDGNFKNVTSASVASAHVFTFHGGSGGNGQLASEDVETANAMEADQMNKQLSPNMGAQQIEQSTVVPAAMAEQMDMQNAKVVTVVDAPFQPLALPTHRSARIKTKVAAAGTAVAAPNNARQATMHPVSGTAGVGNQKMKAPTTPRETALSDAISSALVNPAAGMVAGTEFTSLLMSAIESSGNNMPVISL